jgi:hypothetical protein
MALPLGDNPSGLGLPAELWRGLLSAHSVRGAIQGVSRTLKQT